MNIHVKGKIVLDGIKCQHCDTCVLNGSPDNTEICSSCGAKYKLINVNINNNKSNVEYTFVNFNCIDQNWSGKCNNICPTPYMYCQSHSDDDSIEKAEKSIEVAKTKVVEAEDKLKTIKKSKKTWMITELSGIKDE